VRTLVISDLHLGSRTGSDVLRDASVRTQLLKTVADCDRLVLLGDVLELRQGRRRDALADARGTLEGLGRAVGGGEVVLVPGNHDHALAARWLERRARHDVVAPLGTEELFEPAEGSDAAAAVATWLGPARTTMAYPGIWLRDDVYAIHGHYLDCHNTVPTFERLAAGAMRRVLGALPAQTTPDDYEARLAPIYAFLDSLAQRADPGRVTAGSGSSARAWALLAGDGHRPVRARLLAKALPVGLAALKWAGIGPLSADLSGPELRRAGLRAMGDVVAGLRLAPAHLIFGHTHRPGPEPNDDHSEWRTTSGTRLYNTGSWVRELEMMGGPSSPYRPGACVVIEDEADPVPLRILD
jgi:Calcineurin-like phosphoesterase